MTELFPKYGKSFTIDHKSPVLLIGSCFSDHIGKKLRLAGFDVLSNPYGTIFHPFPLANCLERIWHRQERFLLHDDIWLSYDAGSSLYALSQHDLKEKLEQTDHQVKTTIAAAKTLFITLGSAHGYRLKEDWSYVANCHKQPSAAFDKELTDLSELTDKWMVLLNKLVQNYPELNVVFTVSPVRYSRDGWLENSRSKARLIQLAEVLEATFDHVSYFPAFELVIDILRDYRYFEADGVHPNEQSILAVWKLFSEWFFTAETQSIVTEAEQIRGMEEHRLLFPESRQAALFKKQLQQKRESFLSLHPYIRW